MPALPNRRANKAILGRAHGRVGRAALRRGPVYSADRARDRQVSARRRCTVGCGRCCTRIRLFVAVRRVAGRCAARCRGRLLWVGSVRSDRCTSSTRSAGRRAITTPSPDKPGDLADTPLDHLSFAIVTSRPRGRLGARSGAGSGPLKMGEYQGSITAAESVRITNPEVPEILGR